MRWYTEFEDGIIPGCGFDPRVLDYRMDVEIALRGLTDIERNILMSIHRDGLTGAGAVRQAGLNVERPGALIASLETRVGQLFERKGLSNINLYLNG
jgi:hypothetical protein